MLRGLFTRSAEARAAVALKELKLGCQRLLSDAGTSNGEAVAMSGEMYVASIFLSLIAGLMAGLYPAWRVCTIEQAMQHKLQ